VLSKGKVNVTYKPLVAGTTSNVFKNVILGKTEAGATLDVDFDRETADVSSQLRILSTTEPIAPHPVAAHPRVPKKIMKTVTRALFKIAREPDGRELFRSIRMPDPIKADYGRDYQRLEEIDIDLLSNQI
jgi:phosphonate transport system substrate-binding protein